MSHGDRSRPHPILHGAGEAQQAQAVGHRRPLPADLRGQLRLGPAELVEEGAVGLGLLDGIEPLALQVLDERQLQAPLFGHLPDDGGDLEQTGALGGTPATLPGHDLVAPPARRPDHDRLQDSVVLQRAGQGLEGGLVEVLPRLARDWGE
jgi:hypothetical protein